MGRTSFSGPVNAENGFEGAITLPSFTVAAAPSAAGLAGTLIYVSNGAAGQPTLAFSNGTNWLRTDTRAVISAV
jgi:hypothetical protein